MDAEQQIPDSNEQLEEKGISQPMEIENPSSTPKINEAEILPEVPSLLISDSILERASRQIQRGKGSNDGKWFEGNGLQ